MSRATVWLEDGALKLRMERPDAVAIDDLKQTFCSDWRRYDRRTNVWSILVTQRERLTAFCERHFADIIYLGDLAAAYEHAAYADELAEIVRVLPAPLIHKLYRLLMFELHPDRGGDPDLCRRVNDAWRVYSR